MQIKVYKKHHLNEKQVVFYLNIDLIYGFFRLRVSASEITASARRSANGIRYPPELTSRALAPVAINEAPTRLKFIILKLVGKFLRP